MSATKQYPGISENNATHPIQVVARRTSLSADVIRAWERRYDAVTPKRSATGRRLYSDEDVEQLRLLSEAIRLGRRIGDVARLSTQELKGLIGTDQKEAEQAPALTRSSRRIEADNNQGTQLEHVEICLKATEALDSLGLETALTKAAVACSLPVLLEDVVFKFLAELGRRWQEGHLRLCHEHMATAAIRSFLGAMASDMGHTPSGFTPVLIVTTPDGQQHELGALMVVLIAMAKGWEPLYLGASTPADEIVFAAEIKSARAIALSICYPGDDPHLPMALKKLRRQLPAATPILVGGASAENYRVTLDEIGALHPGNLNALQMELDRLRELQFA